MLPIKEIIDKFEGRYAITDLQSFGLYLNHIQSATIPDSIRGHWHHILPSSMFPEFTSRTAHPWNQVRLKPSDHWHAHYLLYKAVRCQATAYAWRRMGMGKVAFTDKKVLDEYNTALLIVMESCGQTMRGKVAAKDEHGNLYHVLKDDPRLKDGTLEHFAKGTVNVKDCSGHCFKVSKNDLRYTSGEFQHVRKGRITAKTADGTIIDTVCSDPRIASGNLVSINKGFVLTIDKMGVYRRVSMDDPAYLSGELIHARLGKGKIPEKTIRQCPICGKNLFHKDRFHCFYANALKRPCRSCSAKMRNPSVP